MERWVEQDASSSGSAYITDTVKKYQHELSHLLSGTSLREYRVGEVLFTQGEIGRRFFFIKQGKVMATMSTPKGSAHVVAIHARDTFVGDTALDGRPYYATGTIVEKSEIYDIAFAHFRSCVRKYPDVAFMILDSIARKARNAGLQVADLSLRSAKQRVAHFLIELSKAIGKKTHAGTEIQERMTHEILAGITGLARPTLTSVVNDFERSNFIQLRNRKLVIISIESLVNLLGIS
jgi:CRP/FNR family transcriptional regulator, cyclic AMP receptor protein